MVPVAGELGITEAPQWLIDAGYRVKSTVISGYWKDTGNVVGMLEVNRMVLEGLAGRQEGTVDADTELIGHEVGVTPAPVVRRAHRLLLADHSNVQISP